MGIGDDKKGHYSRAHKFNGRNPFWTHVFEKTRIKVEILHDHISYEEAKRLEIYYIARFKRRCDGGCLTNITLGGDGVVGTKRPDLVEWNKKHSYYTGKKRLKKHKLKISKTLKKVQRGQNNSNYKGGIHMYKDGKLVTIYLRAEDLAKDLGVSESSVYNYIKGNKIVNGFLYTRNDFRRNIKSTA